MMKTLPGERWKKVRLKNCTSTRKYAVSNFGRVASYKSHLKDDGKLIAKNTTGKSLLHLKIAFEDGYKKLFVHYLVAKYFLPKPASKCKTVIHLDKNRVNNKANNLKWVTEDEAAQHAANTKPGRPADLRLFMGEKYKLVKISGLQKKYAITNFGRLISFVDDIHKGVVLNLAMHAQGYKIWRFKQDGNYRHYLLHRLVAEYFLPKPSGENFNVVHLNHNLTENRVENLKWLSTADQRKFSMQSESSKRNIERLSQQSIITGRGKKLTVGKVRMLKKIIKNPDRKTRLKMLAKQFGISTMQLYRIQTGENWGWVKV